MSKSKGNVVSPDAFVEQYGSDVFRMYLMFMGPFTQGGDFDDRGITGTARFADRVWNLMINEHAAKDSEEVARRVHLTIKKVGEDIEAFHFNTAISSLMELVNLGYKDPLSLKSKKLFAQILAPLAPHLSEEIWEHLKQEGSIFDSEWPKFDKKYLKVESFELVIQVNGKVRAKISAPMNISKEKALELVMAQPNVQAFIKGKKPLKEIFIPDKLINIVVGD
jgi:leucyl-tRNA synthetase